jgi:carbon-monoxide dehydrogenase large subunit
LNQAMLRTSLATDKVRFVGEPIVAIVTEHPYQGEDAAERVLIDYEVLPAVIDVFESRDGSTLLFEDVGTNVVIDGAIMGEQPPTADFFDGCEVVVTQRIVNQRVAPCPLEVRSGAAAWVDGRLVQWSSTQHAQGARDAIQAANGLEAGQVRVIAPDVGGGFGAKIGVPRGAAARALAKTWAVRCAGSRAAPRACRCSATAGQFQEVTIGGTRDGKVEAYRLEILQDSGGYPEIGAILRSS